MRRLASAFAFNALTRMAVSICLAVLSTECGSDSTSSSSAPSSSSASPASIAGTYRLTLTASASCTSLAAAAKAQSWTTIITQSGATANLSIQTNAGGSTGFALISGNSVSVTTVFIVATVNGAAYQFSGIMTGTASGSSITGTANGNIQYTTACSAADHQFTLVK